MEALTLLEIREKYGRNKPILCSQEQIADMWVIFFDNGEHTGFWLDDLDYISPTFSEQELFSNTRKFGVVDYFEENSVSGECKCEPIWAGCHCGSIIPYVSRY